MRVFLIVLAALTPRRLRLRANLQLLRYADQHPWSERELADRRPRRPGPPPLRAFSGNKPAIFVGLMRGGFGNPFDVNTSSGRPLAEEMREALTKALKAKGFAVTAVTVAPADSGDAARRRLAETGARRSALVTFSEWKSDSMMNTDVHYDVVLVVLGREGQPHRQQLIKGTDNIGSAGLDPTPSVINAYARKMETLFDDPKVIAALRD